MKPIRQLVLEDDVLKAGKMGKYENQIVMRIRMKTGTRMKASLSGLIPQKSYCRAFNKT